MKIICGYIPFLIHEFCRKKKRIIYGQKFFVQNDIHFYYLIGKSFQNDEEWRLFYCDSTLGCRVIQDFDLCKLDQRDVTTGTQTGAKSQKIEYLSILFLYRTKTQYSCYTPHKVS